MLFRSHHRQCPPPRLGASTSSSSTRPSIGRLRRRDPRWPHPQLDMLPRRRLLLLSRRHGLLLPRDPLLHPVQPLTPRRLPRHARLLRDEPLLGHTWPPLPPSTDAAPPRTSRSGRQVRPVDRLNLVAAVPAVAPVPTTYRQAMQDPCWRAAMAEEHQALIDNNTWSLVPRQIGRAHV